MAILYLVRHGEAQPVGSCCVGCGTDLPLNETGRRQEQERPGDDHASKKHDLPLRPGTAVDRYDLIYKHIQASFYLCKHVSVTSV